MGQRTSTILTLPSGISPGRLVRCGGMMFTSSVTGEDPATGKLAADPAVQVAAAFGNLRHLFDQAGASTGGIGLVNVSLADPAHSGAMDAAWARLFPDTATAPARRINEYALPAGQVVQLQASGIPGQSRAAIAAPAASGVRLGDVFFSAPITGEDPAGRLDPDPVAQMRQAFVNMEAFAAAAGGSTGDLIHVLIFVPTRDQQDDMLDAWLAAFPEDGNRPARKAIFDETLARGPHLIQLMCIGVLGRDRRVNLEVPGISKRHPNPMGCMIGPLVMSSGVGGDDPAGKETRKDAGVRAALAFANMKTLLGKAGGSLDDIGLVSITVNTYADESAIIEQWRKAFPDPADEPARHVMAFGGRGSYPVQLHIAACRGRN